jgi:serine/threonine-protein kinase
MNNKCANCQQPLRADALFCANCGTRITVARDALVQSTPTADPAPRSATSATVIDSDALIGRLLDSKYEIVAPIGEGGMGAVYRARRVHIGDEVAVKVLHPRYVNDVTLVERFRREARAAAQLHHPNVVTIHDYGEASGGDAFAYIVMELVQGTSLRGLLQSEGRLEVGRAVALMRDICAGVASAHRRQIVHRDLKPDNTIVLPKDEDHERERVKVVDFGIAKLRDMASDSTLTQAGAVVGTPYYMSPEQCRGESLDARADVYSLGAMLYEMLAGTPPFTAASVTGVIAKHLTEEPPSIPPNLKVPSTQQDAIMRALSKDPQARQKDAAEFAREISAAETTARDEPARVTMPPVVITGAGQGAQQSSLTPAQTRPPVPTAPGQPPVSTDPRQIAPPTQTQPPRQNQPPQQAPPQFRRPPQKKKSRAFMVVGLLAVSVVLIFVVTIATLIYMAAVEGGNPSEVVGTVDSNTPIETQTLVPGINEPSPAAPTTSVSTHMALAELAMLADVELDREDLEGLTQTELRLLRNGIFARHGRVFQDESLNQYFRSRVWYKPDLGFNENLLTAADRANAELIKQLEQGSGTAANSSSVESEITEMLGAWASTMRARQLDQHMNFYADELDTYYNQTGVDASTVRADRARAFERYHTMDVSLTNVKITPDSYGTAANVTFDKAWQFESYEKNWTGAVKQVLTVSKIGGRWVITGEKDLEVYSSQ